MHETVYFWYIHSTDTTNTKNDLKCWLWVCIVSINLSFIYSVLSSLLIKFSQKVWCWTLEKLYERPNDNAVTTLHASKAFFVLFPIYFSSIPSQLCLSVSWYRASLLPLISCSVWKQHDGFDLKSPVQVSNYKFMNTFHCKHLQVCSVILNTPSVHHCWGCTVSMFSLKQIMTKETCANSSLQANIAKPLYISYSKMAHG